MKISMKKIFFALLCFMTVTGYAQDSLKLKSIDSVVSAINNSNFTVQKDSVIQDRSDIGLYIKSYLTAVVDGKELKKYANNVVTDRKESSVSKRINSTNTFYFDQGKLIKVEELVISDDKQMTFDWYYSDNKPLYYSYKSERSESHAQSLLTMGDQLLKQFQKSN